MGYCPCFGRKKGIKMGSEEEREFKPSRISNVPDLSSAYQEANAVGSENDRETILESSDSKDVSHASTNTQTFKYRELATATNNFRFESLVGEGGFGPVYKGHIESTGQVVAVKRLNETGLQGDKEFLVEILMLSLLRHPNLVNLIGYCCEGNQRLLIYEFMPLGSLEYHLYAMLLRKCLPTNNWMKLSIWCMFLANLTPDMVPLDWNTRMKIAAGAAKGLDYLHNQADPPVIYRDLKSSNILLGEGFHPKLSDFGLAKFVPEGDKSHVSTRVMGTHGYCAPEYASTGKLTKMSDIYSFGVVLLELITGQRAIDSTRGRGKDVIVDWARPMLKDRKNFMQLADPNLKGQFLKPVLRRAVELASICLHESPHSRPSMSDIVLALNYLTSQPYDPNVARGSGARERGRTIPDRDGQLTQRKVDYNGSENTPNDLERDRAVAEAKMWGKTWREKRQQNAEND